jgi:parvulin-like peptidyl-prolyl isomerase
MRCAWLTIVFALLAAGCGRPTTIAPTPAATLPEGSPTPAATLTPLPPTATPVPTATPEPLAATVNGQDVLLSAYERELTRCQAGLATAGQDPAACPAAVLDGLVEQAVVEQAANAAGLGVSDADVDAALLEITTDLGGPGALETWLQANHYAPDEFRQALQAELLRARLAEQVAAVGQTAEQVHARAILVPAEDMAQQVLGQLQSGADFATLAVQHSRDLSSRAAGGDLGWFPRGLLAVPEVEAAAFALQPGETSGVIASALGYHMVQVIERDPARALSPAASQALRAAAYAGWLEARLAEASIQRHINP